MRQRWNRRGGEGDLYDYVSYTHDSKVNFRSPRTEGKGNDDTTWQHMGEEQKGHDETQRDLVHHPDHGLDAVRKSLVGGGGW